MRWATMDLLAQARKYVPESLKLVSMFGCAPMPGTMLYAVTHKDGWRAEALSVLQHERCDLRTGIH